MNGSPAQALRLAAASTNRVNRAMGLGFMAISLILAHDTRGDLQVRADDLLDAVP
jgi:hypothetical protein